MPITVEQFSQNVGAALQLYYNTVDAKINVVNYSVDYIYNDELNENGETILVIADANITISGETILLDDVLAAVSPEDIAKFDALELVRNFMNEIEIRRDMMILMYKKIKALGDITLTDAETHNVLIHEIADVLIAEYMTTI